ncbi:hypothetical protein, partial [Streptomyces sp. NPDC056670]|uniref:hypothetical protein n=1 Tax=Streptomyces sp. NPDC056670 TaxID=3345904 RepID=UPI0036CD496B
MDPVSLEHLLYEILAPRAEVLTLPVSALSPGCVLADGEWNRHVVTKPSMQVNAQRHMVYLRHLHGGHDLTLVRPADAMVKVYRPQLDLDCLRSVPTVPGCFVPDSPEAGDRVFHHFYDVHRLGEGRFFQFNGTEWQMVEDIIERGKPKTVVRVFPHGITSIVRNSREPNPYGWFSYLPARHLPYLYVDGVAMRARTVGELSWGDIIRIPGGGRLAVTAITPASSATTVTLTVLQKSQHHMRHFMWDQSEGAVIEHHDSGRTRSLYPTEPRSGERVRAASLQTGDTVITSSGTVVDISDSWPAPLFHTVNVTGTEVDG